MKLMGSFDLIEDGVAHGWVCDTEALDKRLAVEIFADGKLVGVGSTSLFREDLGKLAIGDGHYHFKLPLSYEIFDGRPHMLEARIAKSGTVVYGGPHRVQQLHPTEFDLMSRAEGCEALKQMLSGSRYEANLAKLLPTFTASSFLQEVLQLANARRGYRKISSTIGDNALIATKIAETYMLATQYDKALDAYGQALAMDANFYWARLGFANASRLTGKLLDAYHSYQHAMAIEPAHGHSAVWLAKIGPEVDLLRAEAHIDQRDLQGAAQLLKRIVLAQPDHPIALSRLADVLMEHRPDIPAAANSGLRDFLAAQQLLEFVVMEAEQALLDGKK